MRWTDNYPEIGDTKTVERFAFWPIWIDGETRWLESVQYEIEYQNKAKTNIHGEYIFDGWVKIKWMDEHLKTFLGHRTPPLPPPPRTIKGEVK